VILDDCLSGLDGQTENKIWHGLFGRDGLLKRCRTTVLIASSSSKSCLLPLISALHFTDDGRHHSQTSPIL
jgi:hypothetical protein